MDCKVCASPTLLINPAIGLYGLPVLSSEVIAFTMNDMVLHQCMDLVQVEEGNHRVAVVLGMVVGIPKESAYKDIRAHSTSVTKTVGHLGNFTVGVFEVANIVDARISTNNRYHPPKQDCFRKRSVLRGEIRHCSVKKELRT